MPGTTTDGVPDAVPITVVQESGGPINGEACEDDLKFSPEGLTCKECKGSSKTLRCCGGCWQVWYCSRAHQVAGWPKHKRDCKPYKIANNTELGRYLISTRDIKFGELLLEDPTLIMGPKTITEPVCLACYRPVDGSFVCPDCGFPMCDRDCASAESHVPECKAVQDSGIKVKVSVFGETNCMYECIMPVRILALRDSNPSTFRKLMSLESHAEKRGTTEEAAITQRTVVDILQNRLRLDYGEELINQVLGIIDTNAFEIRLPDSAIMGVYATGALLEHSCIPNTHRTFDADLNLVVRSAVDIKRGEHLQSCYTESLSSTVVRQEHLLTSKFFTCKCLRCVDPTELGTFTSAMLCPTCMKNKPNKEDKKKGGKSSGGGASEQAIDLNTYGVVIQKDPSSPSSPWECLTCKSPLDSDFVTRMTSVMMEEAEELEGGSQNIKTCEAFLDKWANMYHHNHAAFLNIKYALVHLYGSEEGSSLEEMSPIQVLRKESLARQILKVADIIVPGISRLRGSVMYELYQALFYKSCSMFQSGIIPNEIAKRIAQMREVMNDSSFNEVLDGAERVAWEVFNTKRTNGVKAVGKNFRGKNKPPNYVHLVEEIYRSTEAKANKDPKIHSKEAYDCLLECARVLSFEPPVQPEGQLGLEAKVELRNMIRWMKEEGWKG